MISRLAVTDPFTLLATKSISGSVNPPPPNCTSPLVKVSVVPATVSVPRRIVSPPLGTGFAAVPPTFIRPSSSANSPRPRTKIGFGARISIARVIEGPGAGGGGGFRPVRSTGRLTTEAGIVSGIRISAASMVSLPAAAIACPAACFAGP